MSNIHLTSVSRLPRSSHICDPSSGFPWASELACCGVFLAVLALALLA